MFPRTQTHTSGSTLLNSFPNTPLRAIHLGSRAERHAAVRMLLLLLVCAAPMHAQATGHAHAGMHEMPPAVSATARREITRVSTALQRLSATDSARAAGFRPVLGWIPTMGVHWVNAERMLLGSRFDAIAPSQLMYSRINGRDSLVGAAYSYVGNAGDTTRPSSFDGSPAWHEHADLAPPGLTLVMLHVWFVPSPDGPFAGTNPNLPFWALGLPAPDSSRMHDPAFDRRVRRASLALAEIVEARGPMAAVLRRGRGRAELTALRDSVRALMPALRATMEANNAAKFDTVADQVANVWDAMATAYLASAPSPAGKDRINKYFAMLLGEHTEH